MPFGLTLDDEIRLLERARHSDEWARRERELELVLYAEGVDPAGDPAGARAAIERRAEAGAAAVNVRMTHRSLAHCLEQLAAMVEIAA